MTQPLHDTAVLVVHSDPEWRRARARALRDAGASVAEAAGLEEARQALARLPLDVIVLAPDQPPAAQFGTTADGTPVLCLTPAGTPGAGFCLPEAAGPAALVSTTRALADLGRRARQAGERALVAEEEARACRRLLVEMERWRTTLDAILYQMPSGVVVFTREGEIILSNEVADRLLLQPGRRPIEEAFLAGPEAHRPDGSRYALEEIPGIRALRAGETIAREEVHLRYPDGARRIVAVSAAPLRDTAGDIIGSVSVTEDVTESRRAEEEQAQQARLLETIQESVPVGLAYLDRALRLVQANAALAQLAGWPEDEAVGEGVLHMLRNSGEVVEALARAREMGEPFEVREVPVLIPRRPEAGTRYLNVGGAPVKHDGEVEGIVVAVTDVTDQVAQRRRVEAAERAWAGEAGLLAAIVEHTDSWIAYLDRELRFVRANRAYTLNIGVPAGELIGRRFNEVFPKSADLYEFLGRALESGMPQRFRAVPRRLEHRPEQGRLHLHISLVPVKDEQGMVQGVVVSMTDATQQILSRNRMLAAERARAELAEHLGDEINHRVKNNLAMISGLLQMQLLASANPEVAAALQEAVARVRTFSGLHEQMYASHGQDVDFAAVLRRIAQAAQEIFSDRGNVEIAVTGDQATVSPRAATNLSVVANELLTNAVRHGAPGEDGVLRVEATLRIAAGKFVLRVQNSGNPVPIGFDPRQSSGMGLRLVYDLIVTGYHGWFALRRAEDGTVAEVKVDALALRGGPAAWADQLRRQRQGKPPL